MFAQQRLHWRFCLDVSFALLLTLGAVAALGFSA
jgi:hypothetical protein